MTNQLDETKPWKEAVSCYLLSGDYARCLDDEAADHDRTSSRKSNELTREFIESPFDFVRRTVSASQAMNLSRRVEEDPRLLVLYCEKRKLERIFIGLVSGEPEFIPKRDYLDKAFRFAVKIGAYKSITQRVKNYFDEAELIPAAGRVEGYIKFPDDTEAYKACDVLHGHDIIQTEILVTAGIVPRPSLRDYNDWEYSLARCYNAWCELFLHRIFEANFFGSSYDAHNVDKVPILPHMANFCANARNPVPRFFDRLKRARRS